MINESTVMKVLRGELTWSSLNGDGVEIERKGDRWLFPPVVIEPLKPTHEDIAAGIGAYLGKPEQLKEWASFLLAASSLVDLEELDNAWGNELLEVLWDLSFGDPVDEEFLRRIGAG